MSRNDWKVMAMNLQREVDRLRGALRPFAFARIEYREIPDERILDLHLFNVEPLHDRHFYPSVLMADVRRAREVLERSREVDAMNRAGGQVKP